MYQKTRKSVNLLDKIIKMGLNMNDHGALQLAGTWRHSQNRFTYMFHVLPKTFT